jgi:four helix bundle protein
MMERAENIIVKKTEQFADRIIKMCKYLSKKRSGDKDMIRQIYRSGTSVGANTAESQYAQSRADFLTKLTIALKEANETKYWLGRLHSGKNLTDKEYESIKTDNEEIIKILTSITGKVKRSEQV